MPADIVSSLATHIIGAQRKSSMEGGKKKHKMVMFRAKASKGQQKKISAKIGKLRREGKSAKEAAGAAYGMARAGRLGPKGGYRRVGR